MNIKKLLISSLLAVVATFTVVHFETKSASAGNTPCPVCSLKLGPCGPPHCH